MPPQRRPRGRLLALVLAGSALALVSPAGAASQAPYPDEPLVPAQSARAFGDSVGVNARLYWDDTAYGDFNTIQARLRELGVRYIRDGICATCTGGIDRLKRLAAIGIRANVIVTDLPGGVPKMQENLDAIRTKVREAIISIEPPNEPDLSGDPLWLERTRTYQRELWARVKAIPGIADITVLGPAVAWARAEVGDLSAYLDQGNFHPYPGGHPPLYNIVSERQLTAHIAANKPITATEAGYHADFSQTGHPGTSERATAMYIPRLALEGFSLGVQRTYIYQLADAWTPAQAQARGVSLMENSFGLLRSDLSPKPAFLALRNLLGAAGAGSAPVAAPGGLRYGLEGAGPDVRQLLLRSADGSFALVLWRGVSVWDPLAKHDVVPVANPLAVVLGERIALAQRFDPVDSAQERARWEEPRRIPVELGGAPVVLRLTPPAAAPPPALGRRLARGRPRLGATKRRQRLRRRLLIRVRCAAPCSAVSARGTLAVTRKRPRRPSRFRLGPVKRPVRAGKATLRLKIPPRARRKARRALRQGRRVRARVTVTGRSATGAVLGRARTTIVLRR
jgi:hypothetical protein